MEIREFRGRILPRWCSCLCSTNKANRESVPTEYTEHTEPSGRESLPQIGTDTHRLGGYGIPAIPTPPITQPNHLWKSVKSVGEYYHAGAVASATPTKQTERVSHRTRGTHRTFWQRKPPTDRHRCTQIRRVWHPCHTHDANNAAKPSVEIREIRGRISYARNFCEFGEICGRISSARSFREFCEICGRISSARSFREFCEFCGRIGRGWRGYGRMPYPPTKTPTDCTDVHRLGATNAT